MDKIFILEGLSKSLIYVLVFLLPLFFLPFTQNVLDYQKHILLVSLVSFCFIFQIIKFILEAKISFSFHKIHFFAILFLLVWGLSTVFSKSRVESFWGFPLLISQSFLTVLFLVILYFLISSSFNKKEIISLLVVFSLSIFLSALLATFQLFGTFMFPFDFSRQISFNTIGTQNALSLLLISLLPLFLALFSISKNIFKIFFVFLIFLSIFFNLILNFKISFLLLLVSTILLLVFVISKREFLSPSSLLFYFLLLAISLVFLSIDLKIIPIQIPSEISLAPQSSFKIAVNSIKENPILGSGPSTFLYQFLQHKGTLLNETVFFDARFFNSSSKFFDVLSTTGIVGTISFLFLIISLIYFGILKIFKNVESNNSDLFLFFGIFLSLLNFSISSFLYYFPLTFEFSFFLLFASFVSFLPPKKIEFLLKRERLISIFISFVLIFLVVLNLIILIFLSQRYTAEVFYLRSLRSWHKGNVDETIFNLERAVSFNKLDLYLRELSQVYLAKTNQKIQQGEQNVITEISRSLTAINEATTLNPKNSANWLVRGFVYQGLIGMAQGAEDFAIESYEKALSLEPYNPYYLTQIGIITLRKGVLSQNTEEKNKLFSQSEELFKKAIDLKSDYAPANFQLAMVYYLKGRLEEAISKMEETKNLAPLDVGLAFQLGVAYYQKRDYQKAKDELERAISLEPNYANALYFLGLTYDQLGEREKAIEKFQKISELNPDNEEVKKIISNLRAGKEALEGILQKSPPQAPIEEQPPEIKDLIEKERR